MLDFIHNNMGTIAAGAAVIAIIISAAWKVVSDKRKGKSSCSCGCSGCPNAGLCHAPQQSRSAD